MLGHRPFHLIQSLQSHKSRDLSLPELAIRKCNSSTPFSGLRMSGSDLSRSWLLMLKGEFSKTDNLFLKKELTLKSLFDCTLIHLLLVFGNALCSYFLKPLIPLYWPLRTLTCWKYFYNYLETRANKKWEGEKSYF